MPDSELRYSRRRRERGRAKSQRARAKQSCASQPLHSGPSPRLARPHAESMQAPRGAAGQRGADRRRACVRTSLARRKGARGHEHAAPRPSAADRRLRRVPLCAERSSPASQRGGDGSRWRGRTRRRGGARARRGEAGGTGDKSQRCAGLSKYTQSWSAPSSAVQGSEREARPPRASGSPNSSRLGPLARRQPRQQPQSPARHARSSPLCPRLRPPARPPA